MLGLLRYEHDAVQVCTLWFPRRLKPRIASQLLIGNQFPSAFQRASPESDSGLENWRQKPMAQDRQETEEFLFNKKNTPETGRNEKEEGRAFPRLYRGKGGTLGVNRAAFCLLPPWFLQVFVIEMNISDRAEDSLPVLLPSYFCFHHHNPNEIQISTFSAMYIFITGPLRHNAASAVKANVSLRTVNSID